ncbi:MAG: sigma factor [Bryobacteraceae bacterium]|nr:sigma factor [Bryobacteraceae bacterium]
MTAVDPLVIRQAEIRASHLVGSQCFTSDDWDDLRQDLILDYLERVRKFDGERGDLQGFVYGVVRHRAAQMIAQRRRLERLISKVQAGSGTAPGRCETADYDLRLDVEAAVSRLPEHLRVVAQLLSVRTPCEVSRITGKSRSRVYQMIGEIRAAFVEAGLTPELLRQCGGAR